jgi:hypothetical protein
MKFMSIFFLGNFALCASVKASVSVYTNQSAWQSAAGPYSTITFTELPEHTWIFDQYADLGVHFTDGADQIYHNQNIFLNDGAGLNGAFDESTLEFDQAITAIAVSHPGAVQIKLFADGEQIYLSPLLGGGGTGFFSGLISTQHFDAVELFDPGSGLVIDNLYFGPPIPAPAALALLGITSMLGPRRRRIA